MKFLVFILLLHLTFSESWGETNGVIHYGDGLTQGNWNFYSSNWYGVKSNTFQFVDSCCTYEHMEYEDYDYENSETYGTYLRFRGISTVNVTQVDIRIRRNSSTFYIAATELSDFAKLYFGCFNGEEECRKSINNYRRTRILNSKNALTMFGDIDQYFLVNYLENLNSMSFFYIGGLVPQTISINITYHSPKTSYNGAYLFTGKDTVIDNYYNCYDLSDADQTHDPVDTYRAENVCLRKNTARYLFYTKDAVGIHDCSCQCNDNNLVDINIDTTFNYPDCNYNSSIFDLILPSSSSTYSLSDDLLKWYSIQFKTSSQSIQINEGKTITIDELDINQEDISFNENVYVNNLTISVIGATFNILDFDEIIFSDDIENEEIVFGYSTSTFTNILDYGLIQCNNMAIRTNKTNCSCIFDGYSFGNSNENDCCNVMKTKELNQFSLIIESNTYNVDQDEFWYEIVFDGFNLIGLNRITVTICEFEDETITIDCNLYCKKMSINPNTKLVVNGELSIDTLVINDVINNLNENGIIESYGSIQITSIEIKETQSNCFELISSSESISQPSIPKDYKTLFLSQNHLLRICPSSNTNYEVQCTTVGNTFEYTSFDLLHCPCIDSNCTINVNTIQLDSRNIEFNGIFNILTNSTIAISYKTSLFSIEYEDDKQILLIENGAVGFETLNTNSLKSETITLSIQSSNQLPCKALLIQHNNHQCIIEDDTIYPNVGDIDNCQLQNGFGCEICYEGYESNVTYCNECSSNCLRCYNGECINCGMNYQLNETNQCELISNELIEIFDNNKTMKCNDGYYSNTNQCIKCLDNNCITCNLAQCITCKTNYTLSNGNCSSLELNNGEEIISNYGVIDCNDGYYSNNSQCIDCSLTFDNCELCNINSCLSCSNGIIINNGSCSLNTNCLNINDSICLICNDKGSWFNGNECIECGDNCKNCINGYCIECNDGYILQSENTCIDTNEYPDNCITLSYYGTCQRCSDGYYLNNDLCYECPNECTTCHNLTYCFECNDGYMLNSNNECVDMSELNANCKTAIPGSSGGCAICNDGYYRNQTSCESCISNCTKCNNDESCLICESDYFLLNDASECISYDDLTNCETKTQSGCTKCNDTYYLSNQYCISCSDTTENCNTCNNNGECLTCQNGYILINYECIHYQLIDNCKESSDSKCTSCSFWHTVNEDQTGCDTQVVWWVIVLLILFILIIFIGICVLISYFIKKYLNHRKIEKQRKETAIFDIKTSNVQFKSTNNKDVVINTNEILFNDDCEEIGVNEETRDLICVGNTSKHTIKVQFSVKDGCDKYEIRTNPRLITIQKGKAVEFEIFIKPLCTCKINDQIMLISVDLTKGKTITTPITINTITIMTSKLDYSELIEDIKLGEGGFGIVYKGTFRGNQVAIKKIKDNQNSLKQMEEFNTEVSMLDKFRNDYIVHFYGAVFIPNKICMVTEFAQYGSVKDLMNKIKIPKLEFRRKLMLDAAKGISYLHSNGILHRDIKPDNFLVFSLENDVSINVRLTDFGSSRNINMMMTNMTFTKGIGSPIYMAPEVLNKEKYKKSADIYSFALTMFEIDIWSGAYPKAQFKFPWEIANFVTNGDRLSKPEVMEQDLYDLIDKSWKHSIDQRICIDEIIGSIKHFEIINGD